MATISKNVRTDLTFGDMTTMASKYIKAKNHITTEHMQGVTTNYPDAAGNDDNYGPNLYRFHKGSNKYEHSDDNGVTWSDSKTVMNGDAALAFSRMRYGDPTGDYGRQQRQRLVLEGLFPQKLNAAYAFGSTATSIKTVESFLNIPIDFYALVNMGGLATMVDQVGGVSVKSPLDFTYSQETARDVSEVIKSGRPISVLLYGTDTGELGRTYRGRTDSMMLLLINPKTEQTTLISLPRDAMVSIDGYENTLI
ncbi:hypothetical protein GQS40_00725|uniref:Cell envelope-related transcriptional attenuator domain-containing protein n=1 Tax=Leuconostoc lactis TaxID=1246 RepID=A0A6L7A8R3_LEULA|nr:hypothetical protein [Leuconostoc lactis]